MRTANHVNDGERGAVLVHVAIGLIALMAFSTFVFDYGVFWLSRRQAQNAADAGALAGANALAYDDFDNRSNTGPAKESAYLATQANGVFGQVPSVIPTTDITFPACPDDGSNACIRVDVYRTAARSNPLPTFFGLFIGMNQQDVRATATAKIAVANATDCLKPWAVIDKWVENQDVGGWTIDSTFDKYDRQGEIDPAIVPPDAYVEPLPDPAPYGTPGSGFYPFNEDGTQSEWYGLQLKLKVGGHEDFNFATGWFSALALTDSKGGKDYKNNIKGCVGTIYKIGDELDIDTEPGEKIGPTKQGVEDDADSLVNQDPGASWDIASKSVVGSAYGSSPRIVAIPLVNPDLMADAQKGGRTSVPIANILGFFVEGYDNAEKTVIGRLMTIPGLSAGSAPPIGSGSAFLHTVMLIR